MYIYIYTYRPNAISEKIDNISNKKTSIQKLNNI